MDRQTQSDILGVMGISQYERRNRIGSVEVSRRPLLDPQGDAVGVAEAENLIPRTNASQLDWGALQNHVKQCTDCGLHETRTQTVFGVGSTHAQVVFVGEAPGAEEDRQGEPFVGRAGKLLDEMMLAIGLNREKVYIANILKCRPPNNRDPNPQEVLSCEPNLQSQLNLIQPKLIVALGRVAAQNLLKTDLSLAKMRGRNHAYGSESIPVIVTYHPAYLLRSPKEKSKAWQDLCTIRSMIQ